MNDGIEDAFERALVHAAGLDLYPYDAPPLGMIAECLQMATDDMPFCSVSTKIELAGSLYELEADYSPEIKDGGSTGRRFLHLKMKRIA